MHKIPSAPAPVVFIPGLVFEAMTRVRGALYSAALLPQHRLPAPVISIGNITMGGTGKTPLVIYTAQTLSKLSFNPAVLTRGYGRRESRRSLILPPGKTVPSPALILGDEPALVRRHVPSAWMGVSRNRYSAGREIVDKQVRPAFLLDDGFQHRSLHRDLDIVIVDRSQPLQVNRVFPRGTLREPVSGLRRCHVVVINGVPETGMPDPFEAEIRDLNATAEVFHCTQTIRAMIPFPAWKECVGRDHRGLPRTAYLVAAVGNPERFRQDIRRLGIDVQGAKFFRDHYWLKPQDWLACASEARDRSADAIVTTEKDAVKISHPPDFPLLVSVQSTEIIDAKAFERVLKNCIEERR